MPKNTPIIYTLIALTAFSSTARAVDIEALINSMTLDEKVGQMTQAERSAASPNDVRDFFLGSILSGGGSAPASNTPTGWADMHDAYQNGAAQTRLGIPILYGIDAVHGHSNVIGATLFPHNIGLGATRDPVLIEEIARITALEVACTGLEWTFAPCVAVARDERWGRTYEGYGEDPALQTLLAGPFVRGLQGTGTLDGERVVACAKHFIADGGTSGGVDRGNAIYDEATLRAVHLPGFVEAIAQDVAVMMPSYSSWNGVKMHENGYLLNDVLKSELGFDGFVISDWEAVYELSGATYYDKVVQMVNAGVDMGMEPYNWQNWISTVKQAVQNDDISMARIDDAVRRILRVKERAGVFDEPLADRSLVNSGLLGSAAHRAVAREAVRKSLVLLKNESVLPLSTNANVFVAGKNANNIGHQCGGWSISWQGGSGNITPGTTILQGIQSAVNGGGGSVTFNEDGNGSAGHDVAIVVVGETPYAEGFGDNGVLTLDATDLACLDRIEDGIPTVVVLVSGRPMIITNQLADWDALVAAWLPGTEGDGVAEVLFGAYDFIGKLPHSWPVSVAQLPLNVGDSSYAPLFPYGYGLTFDAVSPNITITAPTDGALLPVGDILIGANATDGDGAVVSVDFFAGTTLLGTDTTPPYNQTWNAVTDGCYTIYATATDDEGLTSTNSVDITVGSGCDGQTPFNGAPVLIPGLIEAEDFDNGDAGVAYQDSDAGNNGGQYRPLSDVDIEICTDVGGGHNVGWLASDEWLEYTVNVMTAGTYRIDARVASQDTGGDFSIEFDGQNLTGTIDVPVTGGWQNWTTVSADVELATGVQIMRFANGASGDEYNLNSFDFVLLVADECPGFDDNIDTDNDGVADGCDLCEGFDDSIDTDGDGIPDGCDAPCGALQRGDVDSSGVIDIADVSAFATIAVDTSIAVGDVFCAADINEDGNVNGLDVQGFVELVLAP